VHPYDPAVGPYEAILAAAEEGAQISYVPGYDLDGEIVPSSALTAPDTAAPYPHWTLTPDDAAFSGQPGLLRQQVQAVWAPWGTQPPLETGPGAAPDRLDATVDYTGAAGLPVNTSWRWTGLFTATDDGAYQLKVFVSHQSRAELFIDGLDPANRAIEIHKYPSFPTSYHVLEQSARAHDLTVKDLQQSTWTVNLTTGQQIHLDLRVLTGSTVPTQLQLRWIPPGWQDRKIDEAVAAAQSAKKVIVFAYDDRAEGGDLGGDDPAAGLSLPGYQDALISAVAAVNPSTIVIMNTGGPVLMPWADQVKGILMMWYAGQMGGAATTDILLGDVSPGGKLPVTFPPDVTLYPQYDPACSDRSPGGNCPLYPGAVTMGFLGSQPHGYRTVDYTTNGIFVGYRWYDRENVEPLFPFGHGLSYTRFRYSRLSLTPASDGGIDVRFRVDNIGRRAGVEIAQVYVGPSPALDPGIRQAAKELVQFARVSLAPNRAAVVEVHVGPRELSSWSAADEDWVRGGGIRTIHVGSSSRDIRLLRTVDLGP
jgi:beta-glucosidase